LRCGKEVRLLASDAHSRCITGEKIAHLGGEATAASWGRERP